MQCIRSISIGVCIHEDELLVFEVPLLEDDCGYRPLGGGIEFGEHSIDALKREFREEIDAEIEVQELLGVIENIFEYDGTRGHEIVFVYAVRFIDPSFYRRSIIEVAEGIDVRAMWKPLSLFTVGRVPLYPDGLLKLLLK